MPRTDDFKIDLDTLTLADGAQITTQITADIESDDEGTYFVLTGLRWEGSRIDATDWRWSAVSEWIAQDIRNTFGIVKSAHAANENSAAADRADFAHDERLNARAA